MTAEWFDPIQLLTLVDGAPTHAQGPGTDQLTFVLVITDGQWSFVQVVIYVRVEYFLRLTKKWHSNPARFEWSHSIPSKIE